MPSKMDMETLFVGSRIHLLWVPRVRATVGDRNKCWTSSGDNNDVELEIRCDQFSESMRRFGNMNEEPEREATTAFVCDG